MKRIYSTIVFASLALSSFAGGLLTNTNQHAAFVRNPARYASLETDAIYFNPAGTAFFKEGWALSANWQMVWQDRDVTSLLTKETYEGKVYVPCMPTVMAAYKTGDWTFSAFFGMPGGGGKCEFNNGLPSFNQMAMGLFKPAFEAGFSSKLAAMNANTQDPYVSKGLNYANGGTTVTTGSQFESTQYLFALQLGAAYKISENWSVYAGVRANYASNNYNGKIYGKLNATANLVDPLGNVHGSSEITSEAAYKVDLDQSGIAFAPIIGVDYKVGDFNFAAKYEFKAVTTLKNKLNEGADIAAVALPEFADGNRLRSDAPAMVSLAGSWQATSWFKAMLGATYSFEKDSKVESLLTGKNNNLNLDHNTYELLAGVEFNVTKKLLLSAGVQYSDFGVTDKYISDISFVNDSFMTGLGAKYSLNDNWDLNVGFCYAAYADYKTQATKYIRNTYDASIGVDFRF